VISLLPRSYAASAAPVRGQRMLPRSVPSTKSESGYDDSMPGNASLRWLPRFSIRQLLLATAFVAVGCYALRWASPWWSIVLSYCGLTFVIGGILVAINWPGEPRSFWSGFAVCGIAHWLLVFHPGLENGIPAHFPGAFVTHWLSAYVYHQVKPQLTVKPIPVKPAETESIRGRGEAQYDLFGPGGTPLPNLNSGEDGYFRGWGPGPFYIQEKDFTQVALGLWTLLLAYLGGHVSLALYPYRISRTADFADGADKK
jgi:hypothetical protein